MASFWFPLQNTPTQADFQSGLAKASNQTIPLNSVLPKSDESPPLKSVFPKSD